MSNSDKDTHRQFIDQKHLAYLNNKDDLYKDDLENGHIERSNLPANKEFLKLSGILNTDQRILEIGCGAGSMCAHLVAEGYNVVGTDPSEVLLDYARQQHPDCNFSHMFGEDLRFESESFDVVLSFDVLEHIPDTARHLQEVKRVLRPGGYYLFQTPNKWTNLPYCILKDKSFSAWRLYHPSLQTRKSLRQILKLHGFQVEILRINIVNEFLQKRLIFPLNRINFDRLPIQTNLYAIACKPA